MYLRLPPSHASFSKLKVRLGLGGGAQSEQTVSNLTSAPISGTAASSSGSVMAEMMLVMDSRLSNSPNDSSSFRCLSALLARLLRLLNKHPMGPRDVFFFRSLRLSLRSVIAEDEPAERLLLKLAGELMVALVSLEI